MHRGVRRAAAIVGAVLFVAGCGSDGGEDQGAAKTTSTTALTAAEDTSEPTTTSTTVATTAPSRTGPMPWQSLRVGDCIDPLPVEDTFTEVMLVDCDDPHAAEAISGLRAVTKIDGDDFDRTAQDDCDEELAAMDASGYAATYILEVQGTILARAVCLAVHPTGAPITGSLTDDA